MSMQRREFLQVLAAAASSRATASRPTGTERYALRLIQGLLDLDGPHRFRLYFRDPPPGQFRGVDPQA